jgi:pimeloyl-ACP methyl ester carboxylesterase
MVSVEAGHLGRVDINTWTNVDSDGKPPLVLMHGWSASCASCYQTVDSLSTHHKLYMADWVGFGRSTGLWYEGACCQDAEDYWLLPFDNWTVQLGLDSFALAGHSLGGFFCCKYAVAHRQKVRMLILVSPGGTSSKFATVFHIEKQHGSETADACHQHSVAEASEHVLGDHEELVADDAVHVVEHDGDSDDDHSCHLVPAQDATKPPSTLLPNHVSVGQNKPPPALLSNPRLRDFVWNLSPSGLLRKRGPYGRKVAMRVLKQRWGDHTSPAFTLYIPYP